jgi:hypothetical protein
MAIRLKRAEIVRAVGALLGVASASAGAVPLPADICNEQRIVDKERLALAALAEAALSPYPYRWVASHNGANAGNSPAQQLLAIEGFCSLTPAQEAGLPRCGKEDAKRLDDAKNIVTAILLDRTRYQVPDGISGTASLFAAGAPGVRCAATAQIAGKAPPTSIPAPFDFKKIPLRLRGSSDGLQFDRNRDAAFAGVEKASFAFKSDEAADKDTIKATLLLGLNLRPRPGVFELVPYVGFSTDTTKKEGEEKEVSERSIRTGLLFDFRTHGEAVSHLFLVRPEYAWNRKEKSELITGALTYQPVLNGRLNDAINITTADNRSLFSIIPRGDIRLIGGHFTRRGDRAEEDSRDFVRLGGQVGVTLTSDLKWLPVELTITDTYLWAISGEPDHISYLKGVFSIYFDEKKYFGVDLGYARGRRDDLLQRESSWSAGFAAKF